MALKTHKIDDSLDQALYNMAAAVRIYYILEHRRHVETRQGGGPCTYGCKLIFRWDGGVYKGRVFKPIWPDIVRYALAHKISPFLLVRGTFREWQSPKPPDPDQFTNPAALHRAKLLTEPLVAVAGNLEMEDQRFKSAVTIHQRYDHMDVDAAARRALHDPFIGLSPLYRYCVGKLGGAEDVAERFEQEALQIYFFDRDAYDAVWGERIPPELRQAADRLMLPAGRYRRPPGSVTQRNKRSRAGVVPA